MIEAEAAATSGGGADAAAAACVDEAKNDADGDDPDGARVPARVAATGVDADPSRRLNRRRHLELDALDAAAAEAAALQAATRRRHRRGDLLGPDGSPVAVLIGPVRDFGDYGDYDYGDDAPWDAPWDDDLGSWAQLPTGEWRWVAPLACNVSDLRLRFGARRAAESRAVGSAPVRYYAAIFRAAAYVARMTWLGIHEDEDDSAAGGGGDGGAGDAAGVGESKDGGDAAGVGASNDGGGAAGGGESNDADAAGVGESKDGGGAAGVGESSDGGGGGGGGAVAQRNQARGEPGHTHPHYHSQAQCATRPPPCSRDGARE